MNLLWFSYPAVITLSDKCLDKLSVSMVSFQLFFLGKAEQGRNIQSSKVSDSNHRDVDPV